MRASEELAFNAIPDASVLGKLGLEGYWLDELESLLAAGKVRSIGISLPDQRHDIGLL
jgi:hypothetical protein